MFQTGGLEGCLRRQIGYSFSMAWERLKLFIDFFQAQKWTQKFYVWGINGVRGFALHDSHSCSHSMTLKCLELIYISSEGTGCSQDTITSREVDYSISHVLMRPKDLHCPQSLFSFDKQWREMVTNSHSQLRVAHKQPAAIYINESLHLSCGVRVGVCRVISLLSFLSSPWRVYFYAAGVVGNTLHFSSIVFSSHCNVAHYFFSLDWKSPVGRNVMRNLLLWGH